METRERRLSNKQIAFAMGVAEGMTEIEAYKGAGYNAEGEAPSTLAARAKAVSQSQNVRNYIKELRRENENMSIWSRYDILCQLKDIFAESRKSTVEPILDSNNQEVGQRYNHNAASISLKALEQASKMCGYDEPEHVDAKLTIAFEGDIAEYAN